VRANWKILVGACSICIIGSIGVVVAMGLWANRDMAFFAGGSSAMAVAFVVWFGVESVPARRLLNGAEAERFTAGALRRLRRQGWWSVDDIDFKSGNVDHVLAGPGGTFAVETKWTSSSWNVVDGDFDDQYACRAVRQCRSNGRLIASLLRGHGWVDEITPLLVVWGPGRPALDSPTYVEGVLVVPGPLR